MFHFPGQNVLFLQCHWVLFSEADASDYSLRMTVDLGDVKALPFVLSNLKKYGL